MERSVPRAVATLTPQAVLEPLRSPACTGAGTVASTAAGAPRAPPPRPTRTAVPVTGRRTGSDADASARILENKRRSLFSSTVW